MTINNNDKNNDNNNNNNDDEEEEDNNHIIPSNRIQQKNIMDKNDFTTCTSADANTDDGIVFINNKPSSDNHTNNNTNNSTNNTTTGSSSSSSSSSVHGIPPDGLECLVTMEPITIEDQNYVEYQCYPSMRWKPALMEQCIIEELLRTQFTNYINRVKETDCQAELKRLLASGPPIYIHDIHGLPLNDSEQQQQEKEPDDVDTHICQLWYSSDNKERSAKLMGAVEGLERQQLWDELKQFIIVDGKEQGDDGDDDDENNNNNTTNK